MLFAVALIAACNAYPGNAPALLRGAPSPTIVQTTAGPIEGRSTAKGQAFLGIPYAAAPLGDLRWQPPQAVARWTSPRPARSTGSPCVQAIGLKAATGGGGGIVTGDEDCLYLNLYAPPAAARPSGGWPVMVFIHGGAFTLGAGDNYDPSPLVMAQGMVVVTFNYRLGAFGFLAHPALRAEHPEGGSGNFALLDQQALLRWVRDNAAAVGADPSRITLAGESAGAWSVCQHLVSPRSAGLFHRAILQSGSCAEPLSLAESGAADAAGRAYAAQSGCLGESDADALSCLRQRSTRQVARAPATRRGINGAGSWGHVWGDALVPLAPARAFADGRWNAVPTIVGSNLNEGRLFALSTRSDEAYVRRVQTEYGASAAAVLARYPIDAYGGSASAAYAAVMTDSRFACPAEALRRQMAARAAVYGYEFADTAAPTTLPRLLTGGPMGAYHAAELAYVFGASWALTDVTKFDAAQQALSRRMMDAWGAFVRDGAPPADWPRSDPQGRGLRTWQPATAVVAGDFFASHACDFWQGVR